MNKLALALGTFDGLHRGHLNVLNEAKAFALEGFVPAMLMFDTHPQSVLKGFAPPLLITPEDKEILAKQNGVLPVHISFQEIRNLSPEEFLRDILINRHNVGAVVCGENFLFGKDGGGNSKILCELCEKYGVVYRMAKSTMYKGEMISATRIREALANGDIRTANEMLGRNFSYDFLVVEGNKIGKKILGFPTINQHFPTGFINLKHGVYASQSTVDGKIYPSVTNFGCHPTIGGDKVLSETCILGFDGDLYYQKIRVELLDFIRAEKKFNSKDELKTQIDADSKSAIEIFNKMV
ncbi:MAG: riboflavin biosynthesis protein RibF [Clostridia bacterium]|nr:riboflavin biosynthesis protein RibF [Clostridia bacterium]